MKSNFYKKFNELSEYEDICFIEINEYIKPFNLELNKNGYEIIVRRWWSNFSQNDGELQSFRIDFEKGYHCTFTAQFQIKDADPDDDHGIGFQFIETISAYGVSLFSYNSFKKYKLKFLYRNIEKHCKEVMENSLEKVAIRYSKY